VTSLGNIVREVLAELGADALAVAGVWLRVKARPDADDLARGCEPSQLGAFYGWARELGRMGETALPDQRPAEGDVVLFLENIDPLTPENLRTVLRHELAHALGMEEEEIVALGLGSIDGGRSCCSS